MITVSTGANSERAHRHSEINTSDANHHRVEGMEKDEHSSPRFKCDTPGGMLRHYYKGNNEPVLGTHRAMAARLTQN